MHSPTTRSAPSGLGPPHARGSIALLLASLATATTFAGDRSWNNDYGNWGTAGNWFPASLPGAADHAYIGNLPIAYNAFVTQNVNATIAALTITDGMTLETDGKQLVVTGHTLVSGENEVDGDVIYSSRINVEQGPFATDFATTSLTVEDGGAVVLWSGATMVVAGLLEVNADSGVHGSGSINLTGDVPVVLRLDGHLGAGVDGLTVNQLGDGLIDLDGLVAGDSTINITTAKIDGSAYASLTVNGTSLTDDFGDDLWIGAGNVLDMNLDDGWTVSAGSEIRFFTSSSTEAASGIHGSALTMRGHFGFGGNGAHGHITAPIVFEPTSGATLDPTDLLELDGSVTFNGGTFSLDQGANLVVHGPATLHGGTFSTFDTNVANGSVGFHGATSWNGTVTVDGLARQFGNATVAGATVVNATVFDLDGTVGAAWSVGNSLVVNASKVDTNGSNSFDGSISSSGTFAGKLTINLDDPSDHWTMNGSMTLGGVGALLTTRVAGSPMHMSGELAVSGRVQCTADARLEPGSELTFANPPSELRLAGDSRVDGNAVVFGAGILSNAAGATLTLDGGTNLSAVSLTNNGALELGDPVGAVDVHAFTSGAGSHLVVDLAGMVPGSGHDRLNVLAGAATIAGTLDVRVVDAGDGTFEPELGAIFAIVQAPGSVSGAFASEPVTHVPGKAYRWSVAYFPSEVVLELEEIIPCPSDLSGDGETDAADLAILLGAWGRCGECAADLTGDGAVDAADLAILLGGWGSCPL